MSRKVVQYGAGNIGRSLVGQIFSAAGWEVVFIDVVPEVIAALNARNRYRILVKEEVASEIIVEGVRGVDGNDSEAVAQEIADCDLLSTALGPAILPKVVPTIARGIERRTAPLDIVLCENLRGAPEIVHNILRECLPAGFPVEERVGLVATSIGKMVPIMPVEVRERDPLEVWAEAYNQIVADRHGFIGEIPEVKGLVVRNCFEAYVDQKSFVHNMGHAVSAYLGDWYGVKTIAEAMEIEEVAQTARGAMEESGAALVSIYSEELTRPAMWEHIDDLLRRFRNRALGDTVYRVGRDRPRKYAPRDRMIGSLKAERKAGIDSRHTLEGTAAGMFFSATDEKGNRLPGDVEFEELREKEGIEGVLEKVSGLVGVDPWEKEIIERIEERAARYRVSEG